MPFCGWSNRIDISTPNLVLRSLALSLVDSIQSCVIDLERLPLVWHHDRNPNVPNARVDDVYVQLNSPTKKKTKDIKESTETVTR